MKMTPELFRAQDKMAPGKITSDGFLGNDDRSLIDIIQADEEKASAIGLDWEEVSSKLHLFLEQGKGGLGEPVTIDDTWIISIREARGHLPCPFADGLHRKHIIEVKSKSKNISFTYSQLSLHLITTHHFLQGKGSPFRLEPELLKAICEV